MVGIESLSEWEGRIMKNENRPRRPVLASTVAFIAVAALMAQTAVGADRRVLGEYFTQPN